MVEKRLGVACGMSDNQEIAQAEPVWVWDDNGGEFGTGDYRLSTEPSSLPDFSASQFMKSTPTEQFPANGRLGIKSRVPC